MLGVLRNVGKVFDAHVHCGFVDGECVLRAFEILAHGVDGAGLTVRCDISFHCGHPVAEEDVDVALCHSRVGHWY